MKPMNIRREQMQAFEQEAERAFLAQLQEHLREEFGEETEDLSDEELAELVQCAVARARSHGLTWQSAITGFVTLMFQIAPNFADHPAFQRVLSENNPDEDERVGALFERITPAEWEEAEEAYDEAAWTTVPGRSAGPGAVR